MKIRLFGQSRRRGAIAGHTIAETIITAGVGAILLLNMDILYVFGMKSFVSMTNYDVLDAKSCSTLDNISTAIRGATAVMSYTPNRSITFTNSLSGQGVTLTFNPTAGTLVSKVTGQTAKTNLTGCDSWSFSLFTRAPNINSTNVTFNAASDAASCKLVQMNWHCQKRVLGSEFSTESVQTAQIVLRNKTN